MSCILLRTTCEADFRTLCAPSFILDGSFELKNRFSGVATSRGSIGGEEGKVERPGQGGRVGGAGGVLTVVCRSQ